MKELRYILLLMACIAGKAEVPKNKTKSLTLESQFPNPFAKATLEQDKLLLRIPIAQIGKAMLLVRHNDGYTVEHQQIVWSENKGYIHLESVRVTSQTGVIIPLKNNPSNPSNLLGRFPILTEKSDEKSYLIEISDLFLSDNLNWKSGSKEQTDPKLSYIRNVENLSNEIMFRTIWTIGDKRGPISKPVDFSLFQLPEPMKVRNHDYRMGFFTEDNTSEMNRKDHNNTASVQRWRLEKKFPTEALSEPKNPIVFHLSKEIPEQWRAYVKAGILEWLPTFESAGFRNAILVKSPSGTSLAANKKRSVNRSVVRWGKYRGVRGYEDESGATASMIIDFRTGEILKSDILISSSLQYLSDRYFIRCAPLDKRAHRYPFPKELMGALIQWIVAHEAGHAFGMLDGHFGSYAYPLEKVRDIGWLKKMGHTPSIMSYTRHNFVAQPEDSIPPSLLIQKLGPADHHSIRWAYTPIPDGFTEAEEDAFLEHILQTQDTIPWFRYANAQHDHIGPALINEVVDSKDPIRGMTLGLKNMKRMLELLPMVNESQKDFKMVERLYGKTLALWRQEMLYVMSLIGGNEIYYRSPAQPGKRYNPIPRASQEEAMNFIVAHAFAPPVWLTRPEWMKNISYSSYPDQLKEHQIKLLITLLSPQRMKRLEYMERTESFRDLTETLLKSLQKGLFNELQEDHPTITARRMELQSLYIQYMGVSITGEEPPSFGENSYTQFNRHAKSLYMGELKALESKLLNARAKTVDHATAGHLDLSLQQLRMLW